MLGDLLLQQMLIILIIGSSNTERRVHCAHLECRAAVQVVQQAIRYQLKERLLFQVTCKQLLSTTRLLQERY